MAKFINSRESISSSLMLWNDRPTQVSIEETYDLKVWPITSILNEGPISFNIPPQAKGLMSDINIITKLKIQKDGADIEGRERDLSVINNFANSIWGQVDIQVDDRVDITQSMKNAYAFQTYFNHAINSESTREDYLLYNELFKMDSGRTKPLEENSREFWVWDQSNDFMIRTLMGDITDDEKDDKLDTIKEYIWKNNKSVPSVAASGIATNLGLDDDQKSKHYGILLKIIEDGWQPSRVNPAASERSKHINRGQSTTLVSKLQCPLFTTSKCLPNNMKIRLSLTKNEDQFVILAKEGSNYSILIEDCYLEVTYYKPREAILELMEERIQREPAPYFISKPEIIVKPLTNASQIIRVTDVFHDTLPAYAFFGLQKSSDFEGRFTGNPFAFIQFKKFQFYLNGYPYFKDPLEVSNVTALSGGGYEYEEYGDYLRQLYKTAGKDLKGDCLINSENFNINFIVGMSFGADRSSLSENHLNLQEKASTYLEIDMGINTDIPQDMVLIIYAVFDRQITIDGNRKVKIIE